ncbi:MAG: ATP-binding protein [Bacteroidetes bacterium]|nr:ATP-binding protein [Bacteroidota bacterium]
MFINRDKEIARLHQALANEKAQLIIVYGRRRCGKSTLLRSVLPKNAIYFSADLRETSLQIGALAKQIDTLLPGFSKPIYPDWETILKSLNLALKARTTLCLDEFPYLVKNNPELPSVIQKIIDEQGHDNFNLILCGSSQQMMYGLALEGASPLYGRSDEIIRIKPMAVNHLREYLNISSLETIKEFGVWGGVPRYWEIRKQSNNFEEAIRYHVLDQYGILYEEPERLFSDEMRTSVQAFSVLSLIGAGCHRISEIAGRLGKPTTQLSRLLGFLTDLGYIRREIPFGESVRSTKKSLYKIEDPFLHFYFTFLVPNKSKLEFGLIDQVLMDISRNYDKYLSGLWEELCRSAVPYLECQGNRFNPASRWWGNGIDGKTMEIDMIAESTDKRILLVGEVKWSDKVSFNEIKKLLDRKCANLPIIGNKRFVKAIFLKEKPTITLPEVFVFVPDDILSVML